MGYSGDFAFLIQVSSVEKEQENFGRETILGISFEICLVEYRVKLNEILMRISNPPLSSWVCIILTNNMELGISNREASWEWIRDNRVRGRFRNLRN